MAFQKTAHRRTAYQTAREKACEMVVVPSDSQPARQSWGALAPRNDHLAPRSRPSQTPGDSVVQTCRVPYLSSHDIVISHPLLHLAQSASTPRHALRHLRHLRHRASLAVHPSPSCLRYILLYRICQEVCRNHVIADTAPFIPPQHVMMMKTTPTCVPSYISAHCSTVARSGLKSSLTIVPCDQAHQTHRGRCSKRLRYRKFRHEEACLS